MWAFRVFIFFAIWAGSCSTFCCLRGRGPRPNSKKNKHAPDPSERFLFLLLGQVVVFVFCCLGGGRIFVMLFGRGSCFCFWCLGGCVFFFFFFGCCLGGERVFFFFCCLGGVHVFFLLFGVGGGGGGGGRGLFFFAVWAGDGSWSAWLAFKGPNNNKKTKQQKQKHGFRLWVQKPQNISPFSLSVFELPQYLGVGCMVIRSASRSLPDIIIHIIKI